MIETLILSIFLLNKRKYKLKYLCDYPLQLVSYLGALWVDNNYTDLRKKHEIKNVINYSICWTQYLSLLKKLCSTSTFNMKLKRYCRSEQLLQLIDQENKLFRSATHSLKSCAKSKIS